MQAIILRNNRSFVLTGISPYYFAIEPPKNKLSVCPEGSYGAKAECIMDYVMESAFYLSLGENIDFLFLY